MLDCFHCEWKREAPYTVSGTNYHTNTSRTTLLIDGDVRSPTIGLPTTTVERYLQIEYTTRPHVPACWAAFIANDNDNIAPAYV